MLKSICVTTILIALAGALQAQNADPQLLAEIQNIKAIDNHSHPPKLVSPGEKDDDFDALPCDPLEPSVPTTTSRPENTQYLAAWKALYNYPYDDAAPEHVKELLAARNRVIQQQGDNFPNWVLDQLGIDQSWPIALLWDAGFSRLTSAGCLLMTRSCFRSKILIFKASRRTGNSSSRVKTNCFAATWAK